jgi:hypothetical protein
MRIIDNVEGTVLGIQLFQRKVVLDAYDAWIADIVALTSCLILLITLWYYSRQYNKQAPSELKRV